jgi:hypothetical protein
MKTIGMMFFGGIIVTFLWCLFPEKVEPFFKLGWEVGEMFFDMLLGNEPDSYQNVIGGERQLYPLEQQWEPVRTLYDK